MQEDRPIDPPEFEDDPEFDEAVPERPKPSRRLLTLALIPVVAIAAGGTFVNIVFRGYLTSEHPLALLVVDPRTLNMLLAEPRVDSLEYYLSVIIRRLIADPSYFFLGVWYGRTAIKWIKRHEPGLGDMAVKLEEWFPKVGWLIVLVYPHTLVMVVAGASKMKFRTFIVLDAIGVVIVAVAVQLVGHLIEDQVKAVNGFISDYWIHLTVVSIALFALMYFFSERNRDDDEEDGIGRFTTPESIRRQLEAEEATSPDRPQKPIGNWNEEEDTPPRH